MHVSDEMLAHACDGFEGVEGAGVAYEPGMRAAIEAILPGLEAQIREEVYGEWREVDYDSAVEAVVMVANRVGGGPSFGEVARAALDAVTYRLKPSAPVELLSPAESQLLAKLIGRAMRYDGAFKHDEITKLVQMKLRLDPRCHPAPAAPVAQEGLSEQARLSKAWTLYQLNQISREEFEGTIGEIAETGRHFNAERDFNDATYRARSVATEMRKNKHCKPGSQLDKWATRLEGE